MAPSDLEELAEDIKQNGLREAIVTYQEKILDGRNRYLACKQSGIEPIFEAYEDKPAYIHTKDPLNYVISLNLARRHLTFEQKVKVAANIANMRQGERTDLAQKWAKLSQKQAAEKMNVGETSVEQYKHIQQHGVLELTEAVDAGTIPLYVAYDLSFLPHEQQLIAMEDSDKKILELSKKIRDRRTKKRREKRIADLNHQRNTIEAGLPDHEREYDVIAVGSL